MAYLKQWLCDHGYEKYREARTLSTETSKSDPEDKPYASKYKAREILKSLKSKLEDLIEDQSEVVVEKEVSADEVQLEFLGKQEVRIEDYVTPNYLIAVLNYDLGLNFIECEEVSTGEEYLNKCASLIKEYTQTPKYCCLSICVKNQLSILWSNRSSSEKAMEYLLLAEDEYKQIKESGHSAPFDFDEIWRKPDKQDENLIVKRESNFESIHTLTLYYLAQVYGRLEKPEMSAKYCHVTLARQIATKQYEPLDWSLSCATLSQYYVTQDQFSSARYCLSCAEIVNQEGIDDVSKKEYEDGSDRERALEKAQKSRADILRCWGKYGLNLLKESHNVNISGNTSGESLVKENKNDFDKDFKSLKFSGLEPSVNEERVTDQIAKDLESSKALFVFSTKCLQEAKEFYKLDGYVSDFVEITQDISQLYKYLAFFDNDFENRCKMHKRRIDMLNAILIELNPQHFLQICRQLTFEIAETYGEMAELKKAIIEENPQKFSANSIKKINFLLLQGAKYFSGFIDSYKKENQLPSAFEEDDVRPVLSSFFCLSRLYSKYYTNDRDTKIQYMLKEKECYEYIVSYCDTHENMPKVFDEELTITREMLTLFNTKMNNVLNNYS